MTPAEWLALQRGPDGEVRRGHVAASGCPPAAPVGACQGISHFIRFFVARFSFVSPLKHSAGKNRGFSLPLLLDTAYSGGFLTEKSVSGDRLELSVFSFPFISVHFSCSPYVNSVIFFFFFDSKHLLHLFDKEKYCPCKINLRAITT